MSVIRHMFALSPHNFRLANMMRLGCDIPASSNFCDCGKELDIQGYRLITCKTGSGPVHTHNSIVSTWSNCLSQLNLPHKLEQQYKYVNSDKRSGILVFDPDSGGDIELDVSLAHPWCLDSVKAASREEGVAAMKREEKKKAEYNSELLPEGSCLLVTPLVFKHFGRWGEQVVRYLNKLARLQGMKKEDEMRLTSRPSGDESFQ